MSGPLVIACAALANDLRAVFDAGDFAEFEVKYLPATLHNHPEGIVPALEPLLQQATAAGRPVFVAYADCGTGGHLDALLQRFPEVSRLPGAHCYEFFAGSQRFQELHGDQPGTFYLTDFLAKHFDALVWQGLGLHKSPLLRDMYFANYTRVVYLAQTRDDALVERAAQAARQLDLAFEHVYVGRSGLSQPLADWPVAIRKVHV